MLDVDPSGVRVVSAALRQRAQVVRTQRAACDRIEVPAKDPSVAPGLMRFTMMWGSAATALSRELDLLGVELGKSADAVVAVDVEAVVVIDKAALR